MDESRVGIKGEIVAELQEQNERLRKALEACRQHVRLFHHANGGWWNDRRVYDLIKEHIDPALGTDTH